MGVQRSGNRHRQGSLGSRHRSCSKRQTLCLFQGSPHLVRLPGQRQYRTNSLLCPARYSQTLNGAATYFFWSKVTKCSPRPTTRLAGGGYNGTRVVQLFSASPQFEKYFSHSLRL